MLQQSLVARKHVHPIATLTVQSFASPCGNRAHQLTFPVPETSTQAATINYKIGNERLIKVTENASRKLNSLLEKQGRATGALRVAVIGGGCSGLQYKMDLVDGPANRDIMVQSSDVRVVVDPKSALFVSGSLLDYSDDLQKGGFKVTNPNAVAHCSCGESFAA
jgi:iron-sulfur cluster assembly accessory protein